MPTAVWTGTISFGLVAVPVKLTPATKSRDVSFNQLEAATGSRIRYRRVSEQTGEEVTTDQIVKGYEIEKGRYVVVTDEDIESVRLATTRTLDIERFVDEDDIDRLYWNDPFYLVPDGDMAVEAFTVIREAMEKSGKVALGRLVMHQRERLMALEPRDRGLLTYSIRANREVKNPAELFDKIPDERPNAQMVDIATRIIEQLQGPFDPSQFTDRYEDALRELIREKEKGATVTAPSEPKEAEVIDLMEALKRSLGQTGGERRKAPPRSAAAKSGGKSSAHRKPPARKPAARKRA